MITTGAITHRVDRAEAKGLVERVRDSADRRSVRIRLTDRGLALVDEVVASHLANEARLLASLDPDQREQLAALLRILLEDLGDTPWRDPD
jgi:DNA-binding MarR family transcriptional regulator